VKSELRASVVRPAAAAPGGGSSAPGETAFAVKTFNGSAGMAGPVAATPSNRAAEMAHPERLSLFITLRI